ncbi:unnamed protein product [Durusdinium trenchii]|uniref:Uncharacterized protein n=1 Tax=Durusdinium trenchii TaxID=1381693 RepID=A0ABP0M6R4_9DINO
MSEPGNDDDDDDDEEDSRKLDKKKVPKVHLAKNNTKGGSKNVLCRRDQLRFLKHCDAARFVDGLKEQLTDLQIGMAFYLVCGLPPWHKLREMRCRNLAAMKLRLKEAHERFTARVGDRMAEVNEDLSNIEAVAEKYGWAEVVDGKLPGQVGPGGYQNAENRPLYFVEISKVGDTWLKCRDGGRPRMVIPHGVPACWTYTTTPDRCVA